jgi:hypothetical protein
MDFSFFFSSKNWEIVQFCVGQKKISSKLRQDSPFVPKSTGFRVSFIYYCNWHGGQIVSENSALKVKNTKNSTKVGVFLV